MTLPITNTVVIRSTRSGARNKVTYNGEVLYDGLETWTPLVEVLARKLTGGNPIVRFYDMPDDE
jgi:hypothetical protein